MAVKTDDLLIFKDRAGIARASARKPAAAKPEKASPVRRAEREEKPETSYAEEFGLTAQQEEGNKESEVMCTWHPWRKAFDTCAYCKRPFCFEDLVSEQGKYYCLEDMDKAAPEGTSKAYVTHSEIRVAGGVILLVSFAVFFYRYWQQLVFIGGYANKVGFFLFLKLITPAYVVAIVGGIAALLILISAVMVFMESGKGLGLGIASSIIMIAAMLYSFTSGVEIWSVVVAALSIVSLVLLGYTLSSYKAEEVVAGYKESPGAENEDLPFPNVGRF
ncbi:hypothetical protein M1408_01190 [Candidatus Marsarchaeota archaeon]|nr:hypothetical protein [Candidatus Marsarchaeota archaeon]